MRLLHDDQGFGLIELLVSMLIALVISLAAFSILQFTTDDVSRITARVNVDQTGRVALEKIMLQLHSACVAATVTPIREGSTGQKIRFISETSPVNSVGEPISSLPTVRLHEIFYTSTTGALTEKSWPSTGESPGFEFNIPTKELSLHEKAVETKLLKGVKQSEITNETTRLTEPIPIFRYYHYYKEGETGAKLGQIDPEPFNSSESETKTNAEKVAKVTVSFTLAPEGHESIIAKGDQPIPLEDSAIFRLATSSETSGTTNVPCSPET